KDWLGPKTRTRSMLYVRSPRSSTLSSPPRTSTLSVRSGQCSGFRVLNTLHDVRHRGLAVCMRMQECSHADQPGNDVSEQLQALGDQFRAEKGRPRNITARPPEACDQFVAHRVCHDACDDRDGVRRLLGCEGCRRAPSDKYIDLQS